MTPLTAREREILRLYGQGYMSVEIAQKLGTASRTVDVHLAHVREKLNIPAGQGSMLRRAAIAQHVEELVEQRLAEKAS